MAKELQIFSDKCTGCRSCEIACSYHFLKSFHPHNSKIKINFDANTGDMKICLDSKCNQCKDEVGPLCVKYCAAKALVLKDGGTDI